MKKQLLIKSSPGAATPDGENELTANNSIENISLSKFLKTYCPPLGKETTHLDLKGGKYYVSFEHLGTFLSLYKQSVQLKQQPAIVEQHRHVGPIVIDLDFRMNGLNRPYKIHHITQFIDILYKYIRAYINISANSGAIAYILEKEGPKYEKKTFKDGVHIILPDVITHPEIQFAIRDRFIKEYSQFFKERMPEIATNTIDDIYDEAVIKTNGLPLYGSKKPDEPYAWHVSHLYDCNNRSLTACEDPFNLDLVDILSIRQYKLPLQCTCKGHKEIAKYQLKKDKEAADKEKNKQKRKQIHESTETPTIHLDDVTKLVHLLSPERALSFVSWIRVGLCLYNIDSNLLHLWHLFSKKQPTKYNAHECEKTWHRFTKKEDGLSIGSIHRWAKEDSPQAYAKETWSKTCYLPKQKDVSEFDLNQALISMRPNYSCNTPAYTYIDYCDRYCRPLPLSEYDWIVLHAKLGTGKTTVIIDAIKRYNFKRVLIISPRVIYTVSVHGRFQENNIDFRTYFSTGKYESLADIDRLIISPESLYRLTGAKKYDLVVLDEIEANLQQFSSPTMRGHIAESMNNFLGILLSAKKVIACDGAISSRTQHIFTYLKWLMDENTSHKWQQTFPFLPAKAISHKDNIRLLFTHNKTVHLKRKAIQLIPKNKGVKSLPESKALFFRRIKKDLAKGKKLVVFTSSKAAGDGLMALIQSDPELKHIRAKYYSSDSNDKDIMEMSHVEDIWQEVDIVIYTPSITVGVNFDVQYFDRAYAWLTCKSVSCRTAMQSLHRVRHLKENLLYFFIDDQVTRPCILDPEDWRTLYIHKIETIEEEYRAIMQSQTDLRSRDIIEIMSVPGITDTDKLAKIRELVEDKIACPQDAVPDIMFENEVFNRWEQDVHCQFFKEVLMDYLRDEGYTIQEESLDATLHLTDLREDVEQIAKAKESLQDESRYECIPDVDERGVHEIQERIKNKVSTKEDKLAAEKYMFKLQLKAVMGDKATKETCTLFWNAGRDKRIKKYINNLLCEFHRDPMNKFIETVGQQPMLMFANTKPLEAIYMGELMGLLGGVHSLDTEFTVTKSELEKKRNEIMSVLTKLEDISSTKSVVAVKDFKTFKSKLDSRLTNWNGSRLSIVYRKKGSNEYVYQLCVPEDQSDMYNISFKGGNTEL